MVDHQNVQPILARISQYTGLQAVNRFCFVAENFPIASIPAYKHALERIVQDTWNIKLYRSIIESHNEIASKNNLPLVHADDSWIENTQSEINQTSGRLGNELKIHTTNLVKEGIRAAYTELGLHHRKIGDFNGAQRLLLKAREYCTNQVQIAETFWEIIDLAFDFGDYKLAQIHVGKIEGAIEAIMNFQRWNERLAIITGLCALRLGNYLKAANSFVKVSREAGLNSKMQIVNIAVYSTLCALASYSRRQLKEKILDDPNFRSLLDAEPNYRNMVSLFRENKFNAVFQLLQNSMPAYLTDLYLPRRIERLLFLIQEKAIVQYFSPFSTASLTKASGIFGWSQEKLQERVIKSIQGKGLNAKLDLTNGVLMTVRRETRPELYQDAIQFANKIENESNAAILRLNLIHSDLIVQDFGDKLPLMPYQFGQMGHKSSVTPGKVKMNTNEVL
ncbi:26S proteasome subunit RPN7-domain-containing protein [Phakopsora pachyrhizi]|uniref:26S proteasome subunit RPN7-domain-containing protein n=1 Tax=Phakopsora pachyrhizi TaxID=170000 RepID=A0AAV0BM39_PHAPC|nr:26S proteasome subunit RPN7-domain-containing protein [Phakopsora pachyrhizi]